MENGGTHDNHLARLADSGVAARLQAMGFDWGPVDRHASAALRFLGGFPDAPLLVGLVGGASSGKSTVFNSLVRGEVSRISAHAHETLGPVVAVHSSQIGALTCWARDGLVFPGLDPRVVRDSAPTTGRLGGIDIYAHQLADLGGVILVDLPDVTSTLASREGSLAHVLLPWFDAILVVVDEERWFDAAVFDDSVEPGRDFGPRVWVLFNRTERVDALTEDDHRRLAEHAGRYRIDHHGVSPFRAGAGYRPIAANTRDNVVAWMSGLDRSARVRDLRKYVQHRCAELVRTNVTRARQYDELTQAVERQLRELTEETSLTTDLLTADERSLLGLGHRIVPLYQTWQTLRRYVDRFGRRTGRDEPIDFDKRAEQLADVLRRNIEHRFRHAADRVDHLIADSEYVMGAEAPAGGRWSIPEFDEHEWGRRIRAHIDAWKEETRKHSRRGDIMVLSVGMPLLLADLLFLGGAGVTLFSAAAWVAGMFGGKGLMGWVQRSPAFNEYRTTVRAYQMLIRDALGQQAEQNLAAIGRRHLSMTDPTFQAIMSLSTPRDS